MKWTKVIGGTKYYQEISLKLVLCILIKFTSVNFVYADTADFSDRSNIDEGYCKERNLGWHFYCDKKKVEEKDQKEEKVLQTPQEKLDEIKEKLQDLKVKAVMEPTENNVAAYISFQQEQTKRAAKFSRVWRRVQWKNPNLDYKVKHPMTTEGLSVEYEQKNKKVAQSLADLKKRYGIFYFYKGDDAMSRKFSEIIKGVATFHKLEIRAISLDGVIDKEFPKSYVDKGQTKILGFNGAVVPALALYDTKIKKLIPISTGMIDSADIKNRLYTLTKLQEVDDEDF